MASLPHKIWLQHMPTSLHLSVSHYLTETYLIGSMKVLMGLKQKFSKRSCQWKFTGAGIRNENLISVFFPISTFSPPPSLSLSFFLFSTPFSSFLLYFWSMPSTWRATAQREWGTSSRKHAPSTCRRSLPSMFSGQPLRNSKVNFTVLLVYGIVHIWLCGTANRSSLPGQCEVTHLLLIISVRLDLSKRNWMGMCCFVLWGGWGFCIFVNTFKNRIHFSPCWPS